MGDLFVGIDGGGSRTRVAVVEKDGQLQGFAEAGGCNPEWLPTEKCQEHVHDALRGALVNAQGDLRAVRGVVAGIAGINRTEDERWVRDVLDSAELQSPMVCLNDRLVAQAGALVGRPGVVAIAGTGMVTSAVTETGREVLTWHLGAGGAPGAVALVRQLLARFAAEEIDEADVPLRDRILATLGVVDVSALREALLQRTVSAPILAALAPTVTAAAEQGIPVARAVCDDAVESAVRGIRLVGYCIGVDPVPVVLIGGVIRSQVIRHGIEARLNAQNHHFEIKEPMMPPVGGAALLCLERFAVNVPSNAPERLGAALLPRCPV